MTGELPFPLAGSTLILGPSNVGKTRLTARALAAWVEREGAAGVVVLEFGPEFEHEGRVLGRRLSRFDGLPAGVWEGVVDAHAPRAEGASAEASLRLAGENADRARGVIEAAPPEPQAVFVNDATIAFQHDRGDPATLTSYCDRAACAVVNAFESDELGTDDAVSRHEADALRALRAGADRVIELS